MLFQQSICFIDRVIDPFQKCKDVAMLMKSVNATLTGAEIGHLYWYTSISTANPLYNIANSMFYTGQKDMKHYFGILYPFYEALRNYCNIIAM